MRRLDLLKWNAAAVAYAASAVRSFASNAVVIVLTNPLDEMTALAQAVSGLPVGRVLGQAGILDSARFRCAVSAESGVPADSVEALVLGPHSEHMVPLTRSCRIAGRPLADVLSARQIDEVVKRTREGGTAIVELLASGSTTVGPSAAILEMVLAIVGNTGKELPVCARLRGEYGLHGIYLGVLAALGSSGVVSVIEQDLHPCDLRALRAAAARTRRHQRELRALAMRNGWLPQENLVCDRSGQPGADHSNSRGAV